MLAENLARYVVTGTEEYVGELVRSGLPENEARENAATVMANSFPDGVPANGNEVFDVCAGDEIVGLLWLGPASAGTWYVMDFEIRKEFRRRGYGRETMLLAERVALGHGASHLGLNVFGHKPNARALYESLGYETQAVRMRKRL